ATATATQSVTSPSTPRSADRITYPTLLDAALVPQGRPRGGAGRRGRARRDPPARPGALVPASHRWPLGALGHWVVVGWWVGGRRVRCGVVECCSARARCKGGGSVGVAGEDPPVGPLGLQGAVVALHFAVLPGARQPPPSGIRPIFFTAMCTSSPDRSRSYRLAVVLPARTTGTPSSAPIQPGPRRSRSRNSTIRRSVCTLVRGEECGREDRSCSPASPSGASRSSHVLTHLREIPIAFAICDWGHPAR
ncbi:hypothetical protein SAMN05421835_1591, partial [Amycolatopsis sacchari]